jgi:hypothetical protein
MTTRKLSWISAAIIGLALGLLLGVAARAEETNATPKKGIHLEISTDDEKPLPKEIMDRLTPEQIYELEIQRIHNRPEVPSEAPLIVGIVFACPVLIVIAVLVYRFRRNAMLHRTLAAMIEKGVPIPPELLAPEPRQRVKSDLQRGLVLIAVGMGLIVYFLADHDSAWGIGFIPLLMGVGYLIAWKMEQSKRSE